MQAVYLGLAIILGGGLVLFGVGAGNGLGGLLNAFTGKGSSSNQTAAVSQQQKAAIKATQVNPASAAAWAALVQARYGTARSSNAYVDPNTGQFTAAGKKELTALGQDYQRYKNLVHQPDPNISILAARAYSALGDYANQAAAWEIETAASPKEPKGFECLAASAYAAKQTRKGDLAAARAVSLSPKVSRLTVKQTLQQAKTNPAVARQC